ncbi:crossover junction endodeoxyribonuclease RuvC [Rhodobium gokarnense]|uniref:Crossover junction endodeoxyribonuclease RuvC n=1 Tax=Rhodobium gokarnense TaxID=364296 RepID=A0ABT3H708_9HYPH|nr:crossover junction endodeoxyribonuclease RuvC [Rhodobium gokarnense]MCW2306183.1 crossover junction endodeoxyribonuclease RuvC [Rhodobium gokarnense]
MEKAIRIIGIDPGLRHTGWGVIEVSGNNIGFVASGTVHPPIEGTLAERLVALHDALDAVVAKVRPDEAAVEATFVNRDAKATLKLGQARGIALLVPGRMGLSVAEYAPNAIKKAIVGAGHADKGQIRVMVKVLLPKATFDSDDAADALAIALCHAHHRGSASARIAMAAGGGR